MVTSRLVTLIDTYKHAHGVPDAELARRIGVSRQNLSLWRTNGFRALPERANLDAVASVIGLPYRDVLSAALHDTGYATAGPGEARSYGDVLADAIGILSEASRLTNPRSRRAPGGGWESDPEASDPIDWAEFVTLALAGTAANAGGIDAVLAGRPESWEASAVRSALIGAVGEDEADLWRHRTEPVDVVLHPERLLSDMSSSAWTDDYDAAEDELQRRESELDSPDSSPLLTEEQLDAAIAAEQADPTPLTPEEQARDDALHAIGVLRARLEAQRRTELAAYGEQVAAAVTERLKALKLPVPIAVTVDLDTPLHQVSHSPFDAWVEGPVDIAITTGITETPTPDSLPGTALGRAEA